MYYKNKNREAMKVRIDGNRRKITRSINPKNGEIGLFMPWGAAHSNGRVFWSVFIFLALLDPLLPRSHSDLVKKDIKGPENGGQKAWKSYFEVGEKGCPLDKRK
jgi:hypothetical protein